MVLQRISSWYYNVAKKKKHGFATKRFLYFSLSALIKMTLVQSDIYNMVLNVNLHSIPDNKE